MDIKLFIQELAKLKPTATFLTLSKYKSNEGQVADYNIVFHISYKSAIERSIIALQAMSLDTDIEQTAREELLASFNNSLVKMEETPIEEDEETYTHFFDNDGKPVKGIKLHRGTNTLHLYGSVVNKKVYVEGNYKKVNSRPLTIAKNKLRAKTPVGNFRQFKLVPNQVERISVQHISLLPPSV